MLFAVSEEKFLIIVEQQEERALFAILAKYFQIIEVPGWHRFIPQESDYLGDDSVCLEWKEYIKPELERQWERVGQLTQEIQNQIQGSEATINLPKEQLEDLICALNYFRYHINDMAGDEELIKKFIPENEFGEIDFYPLLILTKRFRKKLVGFLIAAK